MRLLASSLCLALLAITASAQTRLDSSQVIPLSGAAQGPFNATFLRDLNSALGHGNGATNSIASAIADCGTTISCSILVPPSYGTTEKVPGYALNFNAAPLSTTTPGNISIFDRRYSDARMFNKYFGFQSGYITTPTGWLYDYYSPAASNATLAIFSLGMLSLDGGHNLSSTALGYTDKTTWVTGDFNSVSHSPGQHGSFASFGQTSSLGTHIGLNTSVTCYGGAAAQNDAGCRAEDNVLAMGNVEYSGTLSGTPTVGATTLTVSPVQGAFTQGAQRFLARMSAGTISAGTISQVNVNPGNTQAIGASTNWPVSSVIAQLGTNVSNPGSVTVTPASFSVGAMSGIQTSSLVCVSDSQAFEMLYPTSVTATTFTATFAKVHPNNATIAVGGLCGYLFDFTADDVTNATYPTKSQTITGTLHFAWPVVASNSPTSVTLWVAGDGVWQYLPTRWNPSSANGYLLYPFAEVVSTQLAGGLSDTLTLGPNNVAWSAADTVSEFIYPAVHFLWGNEEVENYYPNIVPTDGFALRYNMPLQGSDAMVSVSNNAPTSFYTPNGGRLTGPFGVWLRGELNQGLVFDRAPDSAAIQVGCVSPCSNRMNIVGANNPSYYDFASYDPSQMRWILSANSNGALFYFGSNSFNPPFSQMLFGSDSGGKGYIGTHQIRTATSANSDAAGELVFSNAAAATQTLQGTYASHPECSARPQFDPGSTTRYWISYTASSFTLTFSAPVSGTVSYSCAARN